MRANLLPVSGGTVKQCRLKLRTRVFGQVFRTQDTASLTTTGTSFAFAAIPIPGRLAAKTDVVLEGIGIGASVSIDAIFDILLIEN